MKIKKEERKVEVYSYVCDFCNTEVSTNRVCSICGKNICYEHSNYDPREYGDYPTKYCGDCFNVGKKYLKQIENEENKHNIIIEKLENNWIDEAIQYSKIIKEKNR